MDELVRTYVASPTFVRVHASEAAIRGIMGPVGSGKTVGSFNDWWFNLAMQQPPNGAGVRKRRLVVVRNTYAELQSTSIKTFMQWFGEIARLRLSVPIEARINYPMDDGTRIEAEVMFLSMDRPVDTKKLKSLDTSDVFLNEASELSKTTFDMATARIGRYPREGDYECRLPSLIMDTNPCDDDHWYYKLAERPPEEAEKIEELERLLKEVCGSDRQLFEFFRQPPAMLKQGKGPQAKWLPNPQAENIENLPGGYAYYITQLAGKSEDWIKVFVQGDYGVVTAGRPVYPEFSQSVFVAPVNHTYDPRLPLLLGWDFGHTPTVQFAQISPRGRLLGLDELCGEAIGLNTFLKEVVIPHMRRHYPGAEVVSWADPAGEQGSQHDKEMSCIKLLNDLGIPTKPAHSNDPTTRREAVVDWMQRMVGGEPAMSLSPKQRKLIRGMAGKYFYQRLEVSGEERFRDVPVKNMYSHPCFVAGTPVATPDGDRPIETLRSGDLVCTPLGARRVACSMARPAPVIEVRFSNNVELVCTPDHPFYTARGFVHADQLTGDDVVADGGVLWSVLFRLRRYAQQPDIRSSSSEAFGTTESRPDTSSRCAANTCTAPSGKSPTVQSLMAGMFIMSMATAATTIRRIWSAYRGQITARCTWSHQSVAPKLPLPFSRQWSALPNGDVRTLNRLPPLAAPAAPLRLLPWFESSAPAHGAAASLPALPAGRAAGSVRQAVKAWLAKPAVSIAKRASARCAAALSAWIGTHARGRVRLVARRDCGQREVFNIEAEEAHCYYVDGLLVSNCEAWQYLCMGTQLEVTKAAKAVKRARNGHGRTRVVAADAVAGY